ncbi:DMT family transporter [Terriglobus sp. RCC_193]|uniref:DMT family transporter n=1 Tax=Terriglobus sp. RCC_193 TaxID=3239218 RepID=UPI003524261B
MSSARRQSLLAHGLLLAVVAVWGATFGIVHDALRDCSPLLFVLIRMALAFAALAIFYRHEFRRMSRTTIAAGAIAGFFLATGYALQTAGLMTTTATHSAFLTGLVVVIVPILCLIPALRPTSEAPATRDRRSSEAQPTENRRPREAQTTEGRHSERSEESQQRLTPAILPNTFSQRTHTPASQSEAPATQDRHSSEAHTVEGRHPERSEGDPHSPHATPTSWEAATPLLGACGAFIGIVLLTTPANLPLTEFTHGFRIGDILSLLCAFAFSGHLLSLAHLAKKIPTSHLATLQIGFATVFLAIVTPLVEHPHLHWTGYLVFALLLCSLVATAAAFYIQSWAQQHLAASHTALLLALEPAFALLTALIFFGERLTLRSGLGATLILISLIASELLSSQPVSEQPEANAA